MNTTPNSFRQMLVIRGHKEADLDLMLSMLINEHNRDLLQSNGSGIHGIEMVNSICTPRWLTSRRNFFDQMVQSL